MTEQEENDLRALGNELSGALQSPWEPRCVAAAFAQVGTHLRGVRSQGIPEVCPYLPFTMQMWIDLEALRSPLLNGQLPVDLDELSEACEVCGLSILEMEAEEQVIVGTRLRDSIAGAFAMILPMRPPQLSTLNSQLSTSPDGFGSWLPLFAFLLAELRLSMAEARALPVGQAFALLAARRRNQGWEPSGTPYALRDAASPSFAGTSVENQSLEGIAPSMPGSPGRSVAETGSDGALPSNLN